MNCLKAGDQLGKISLRTGFHKKTGRSCLQGSARLSQLPEQKGGGKSGSVIVIGCVGGFLIAHKLRNLAALNANVIQDIFRQRIERPASAIEFDPADEFIQQPGIIRIVCFQNLAHFLGPFVNVIQLGRLGGLAA